MLKKSVSIIATLLVSAKRYHRNNKMRAALLQEEIAELEAKVTEKKAELEGVHRSPEMLKNFRPKLGNNFQCPRCWINKGTLNSLRAIVSKTPDDYFQCESCGAEFEGIP